MDRAPGDWAFWLVEAEEYVITAGWLKWKDSVAPREGGRSFCLTRLKWRFQSDFPQPTHRITRRLRCRRQAQMLEKAESRTTVAFEVPVSCLEDPRSDLLQRHLVGHPVGFV
jgi:hypothetical protein